MADVVRVLYIDDDAGLGRLMQKALAPRGFVVHHVETGDAGVRLLRDESFDIVALDHNLTNETGLDVLARLKDAGAPPIVYVTGSEDARVAVAALKAGAVDYVWKDVDGHYRELVGEVIQAALQQERMRREKEEAQREIAQARARAELLLVEVNHRVANSLALIGSIARMQSRAVTDEAAQRALADMQARIAAIATVHRSLYTSADVRIVELDAYLRSLISELKFATDASIHQIETDVEAGVKVATDKAVSIGVIVVELVTNACKYAYPKGTSGRIGVFVKHVDPHRLRLVVEDDGVGMGGASAPSGSGVGSRIITAMATTLGTSITYDSARGGTCATIDFAI
jgi:two-component sensor histidine kinase